MDDPNYERFVAHCNTLCVYHESLLIYAYTLYTNTHTHVYIYTACIKCTYKYTFIYFEGKEELTELVYFDGISPVNIATVIAVPSVFFKA